MLAARVQRQTARALDEADGVLFVVDARAGVTPLDRTLADMLRRGARPVILLANKCEGRAGEAGIAEAFALGLGPAIPFSAEHGDGLALLYDALQPLCDPEAMAAAGETAAEEATAELARRRGRRRHPAPVQLAVVGRPNVGKSTLINRLIGSERLVTGPEAGITRDAIAVDWRFAGRTFRLFDTAGLRRRSRVGDKLEQLAGADTLRAIRFAQVVVIVIDGTTGLERQDLAIARSGGGGGAGAAAGRQQERFGRRPRRCRRVAFDRLEASLAAGARDAAALAVGADGRWNVGAAAGGAAPSRGVEPQAFDTPAESLAGGGDGADAAAVRAGPAGEAALRHPDQDASADVRGVRQPSGGGLGVVSALSRQRLCATTSASTASRCG